MTDQSKLTPAEEALEALLEDLIRGRDRRSAVHTERITAWLRSIPDEAAPDKCDGDRCGYTP